MKYKFLAAFFILLHTTVLAQEDNFSSQDIKINEYVQGTLIVPAASENPPLVIMVQGSGPTDRDGNQAFMKNNSLKNLAQDLADSGIATFRFDKRIMNMGKLGIQEKDIRFQDFITDVASVLEYFEDSEEFGKTIVLGHSQGSLVGMLAAKGKADALISIAGVAQPIDSIITGQIAAQMPGLKENVHQTFKEMRETGSSSGYNPMLESLFRPSVQPFILSWMEYNPQEEIAKLEMPVLLINGTKDLQVNQSEAEKLEEAYPAAELLILDKMNHVFRKIEGDQLENSKSYNEPMLPLHPELVPGIVSFIENLK